MSCLHLFTSVITALLCTIPPRDSYLPKTLWASTVLLMLPPAIRGSPPPPVPHCPLIHSAPYTLVCLLCLNHTRHTPYSGQPQNGDAVIPVPLLETIRLRLRKVHFTGQGEEEGLSLQARNPARVLPLG